MINKDKIAEICGYILQGLSEDEACLMCDIEPSDLRDLKGKSKDVYKIIEKQKISFELAHLKEMQSKKSEKNSQWLLEKLRSEKYGTKAKSENNTINIISQIMNNIQNGEETSKISPKTRGDILSERSESDVITVAAVLK